MKKPRLRPSRRPIPSSLDKGSGTWTEVLYYLWRRGRYYRRAAFTNHDLQMVHIYRIHSEMCDALVAKLDDELRFQSYRDHYNNGADNAPLSAQSTPKGTTK